MRKAEKEDDKSAYKECRACVVVESLAADVSASASPVHACEIGWKDSNSVKRNAVDKYIPVTSLRVAVRTMQCAVAADAATAAAAGAGSQCLRANPSGCESSPGVNMNANRQTSADSMAAPQLYSTPAAERNSECSRRCKIKRRLHGSLYRLAYSGEQARLEVGRMASEARILVQSL